MFGVGFFELIIIAVVALVVVGPKRLPEVMRQAGRLFVHVRRTANDVRSTFDQVIREAEDEIRREEAANLRLALKPIVDAHQDVKALVTNAPAAAPGSAVAQTANAPTGTTPYVPGGAMPAAPIVPPGYDAIGHQDHPATLVAATPAPAPAAMASLTDHSTAPDQPPTTPTETKT